jgi:hypothetical protein
MLCVMWRQGVWSVVCAACCVLRKVCCMLGVMRCVLCHVLCFVRPAVNLMRISRPQDGLHITSECPKMSPV